MITVIRRVWYFEANGAYEMEKSKLTPAMRRPEYFFFVGTTYLAQQRRKWPSKEVVHWSSNLSLEPFLPISYAQPKQLQSNAMQFTNSSAETGERKQR